MTLAFTQAASGAAAVLARLATCIDYVYYVYQPMIIMVYMYVCTHVRMYAHVYCTTY